MGPQDREALTACVGFSGVLDIRELAQSRKRRHAGHSLATCDKHYARVFKDASMAERVSAEEAICVRV